MTIEDMCKRIFEHNTKYCWDYYNLFHSDSFNYYWNDPEQFVKQMFDHGGKSSFWEGVQLEEKRYKHMMCAFFLGHYIKKEIPLLANVFEGQDAEFFSWAWFLCCLYHDAFFDIEREKDVSHSKNRIGRMRGTKYGDDYMKYSRPYFRNGDGTLYDLKTINRYDTYRFRYFNGIRDHGIIAGDQLARKYSQFFCEVQNNTIALPDWLKINDRLNEKVQMIARVIACHNIFICTKKEDERKYRDCDLEHLILTSNNDCKMPKRLSTEGKLYFLLCLCDSIEPTKRGFDDSSSLNFQIDQNCITVILTNAGNNETVEKYIQTQEELNKWLRYVYVTAGSNYNTTKVNYRIDNVL